MSYTKLREIYFWQMHGNYNGYYWLDLHDKSQCNETTRSRSNLVNCIETVNIFLFSLYPIHSIYIRSTVYTYTCTKTDGYPVPHSDMMDAKGKWIDENIMDILSEKM